MKKSSVVILKTLGAISLFCAFYPSIMFLRDQFSGFYANGIDRGSFISDLIFFGAVFLVGFLASSALVRPDVRVFRALARPLSLPGEVERNTIRFAAAFCYLLSVPAAAAAFAWFSMLHPEGRHIGFECVLAAVCIFPGVRCGMCDYGEILNLRYSAGAVLALIFTSMLDWYYGGYIREVIPAMMCIFVFSALIVINQAGLDSNVFSKRRVSGNLPTGIRRTSLIVIGVVMAEILLLLTVREQVMEVVGSVLYFIVSTILWLINMLGTFMNLVLISGDSAEEAPNNFDFGATAPSNQTLDYILFAILIVVAAYSLFKLLPKLLPWLRRMLRRFLGRLLSAFDRKITQNDAGVYSDTIEEIEAEKSGFSLFRSNAPRLSALKKLRDPVERMRYTYKMAMYELGRRAPLKGSDTTGELRGKADEVKGAAGPFARLSGEYDKARYRGDAPSEAALEAAKTDMFTMRRLPAEGEVAGD